MKRFHVNLTVSDLDRSIAFYSELFAVEPAVRKSDYAKWMLEDPKLNFALSTHGSSFGIDHIGIEAEHENELAEIRGRLEQAASPVFDQPDVTCCYARSTKAWIRDPDGVAWETFFSSGQSALYGDGSAQETARLAGPEMDRSGEPSGCCGSDQGANQQANQGPNQGNEANACC